MNNIWSNAADLILKDGLSLESLGIKNWALGRSEAIDAVSKLVECGIPTLGCDVYLLRDEKVEQTYDSWYCNRLLDEPEIDFAKRSAEAAIKYMKRYSSDFPLFAIVPKV